MRAGKVTSIRVNPGDCLGVLDVLEAAGVSDPKASFAQHVSLALSICLETMRKNGMIPERSGFEYAEMMSRFDNEGFSNRKYQLQQATNVHLQGSKFHVPAVHTTTSTQSQAVSTMPAVWDPEGDIPLKKYKPDHLSWTMEEKLAEARRLELQLDREGTPKLGENVKFAAAMNDEPVQPVMTPEQREVYRDLQGLIAKKQGSMTNKDIYWGTSDEAELQRLRKLVFPEDFEDVTANQA